jgi:hypothetical protein
LSAGLTVRGTAKVLDSVAIATNPQSGANPFSGPAMAVLGTASNSSAASGMLRNDTVVAPATGDLESTLELIGQTSQPNPVSLVNTVVGGSAFASGHITVTFSHTVAGQFSCIDAIPSCGPDATDATGSASLVDPLNGDVRQKPDSILTIDKGIDVPELTDFDGQARKLGPATDIGADEIPPLAVPVLTSVSGITTQSATVHGTIDPGPIAVTYRLEYGANAFDQQIDGTAMLIPGGGPQSVTFELGGLQPSTTFTARLVATNYRGTATSATQMFMTAAPPSPTPTPAPSPTPTAAPTPTPTPTGQPSIASQIAAALPSNRVCLSRRRLRIHIRVPKGVHVKSAAVFVGKRRVATRSRKRISAVVNLRGLPKGRFTVKIVLTKTNGKKLSGKRTYRTCANR